MAADTQGSKKKKSSNEIDDIFEKKTIKKSNTDTATKAEAVKKAASKKSANKKTDATPSNESKATKEKEETDAVDDKKVEEIVFAELRAVKNSKRPRPPVPRGDDEERFADTRGKKTKRTTEEGYPLYDVKDLRIGEGKDTPLCPFDCDCCY